MEKEENMFGMRVLRKFKGPASHLVSLQDSQNRHFVGIVFYDRYLNHSAITNSLEGLMGFLQCPVAKGITPLYTYDSKKAGFIYETGKAKSVAEMIRQASDLGLKPGPRAGLQLIVEVAEILRGAVRIAEEYAIASHGGLTPWRIMVRPDGKLQVIGFAVPQVEVLDFSHNPNNLPSEDSFRYVPPERLSSELFEDISSDLFSLALIGFEVMTTRPIYDGSANIIQESASRADVSLKLNQALMDGLLDRNTHDFLDRALRLYSEDRFRSVDEMIREGRRLLGFSQLRGMSLFELVGKTDVQVMRRSQELKQVEEATGMFDRSALQAEEQDKIEKLTTQIKQDPNPVIQDVKVEPQRIPEAAELGKAGAPNPASGSPKDLLRLLRESQINIPAADAPKPSLFETPVPEIIPSKKEEQPVPKKPDAKSSSLLSALRESLSSSAQISAVQPEIPHQKIPVETEETSKAIPPVSASSNLAGLLSKPERSSQSFTQISKTEAAPDVKEKPKRVENEASASLRDSLLKSLLSKPERKEKTAADPSNPEKQRATKEKDPPAESSLDLEPFGAGGFEASKGEGLDDELDDAATSIMTRSSLSQILTERKDSTLVPLEQKQSLQSEEEKPKERESTRKMEKPEQKTEQKTEELLRSKVNLETGNKEMQVRSLSQVISSQSVLQQIGDVYGAPLAQKSSFPSNKGEQFVFSLGEGIGTIKQSLHGKTSSASVIYLMLLHRLLPVRTDLTGSITSMYRPSRNGEPVSGLELMSSFDSKQPILLCSVPNEVRLQTFEVWKDEELMRFMAPVGMAVPISSLLDHLVSWLRLEKTTWQMTIGDIFLEPANILFDVQEQLETNVISLKKRVVG